MAFSTISMRDLEQYIETGQPMELIDLRNRASYDLCHIQDAKNIPFQELDQYESSLPKDKILVLYCSRGGQSMLACSYLEQRGFHPVNVAGGIAFYHGKYLVCK